MNNDTLNTEELDNVSGGIDVRVGLGPPVAAIIKFLQDHHGLEDAINFIKSQQK